MPNYRIYLLDQDDRVFQVGTLIAVTDDEARSRVGTLAASAIEVWHGTRCVGRTVADPVRGLRSDMRAAARDANIAAGPDVPHGRHVWNEGGGGGGYV